MGGDRVTGLIIWSFGEGVFVLYCMYRRREANEVG